jgi:hypothetical protein
LGLSESGYIYVFYIETILAKISISSSAQARGSEPPARIVWYMGTEPVLDARVQVWFGLWCIVCNITENYAVIFTVPIFNLVFSVTQQSPMGTTTTSIFTYSPGIKKDETAQ